MFTTAHTMSPHTGRSIQSTDSHPISLRSIFLTSHLCLRFSQLSLYLWFLHHNAECIHFFPIRAMRPVNLVVHNLIPRKLYGTVESMKLLNMYFPPFSYYFQLLWPTLLNTLLSSVNFQFLCSLIYRGADKSLARPTSQCILFDG